MKALPFEDDELLSLSLRDSICSECWSGDKLISDNMYASDTCEVSSGHQWAACVLPVFRWYCMVRGLSVSSDRPHPSVVSDLACCRFNWIFFSVGCDWWHAQRRRHLQLLTLSLHRFPFLCSSSIGGSIISPGQVVSIYCLSHSCIHIDSVGGEKHSQFTEDRCSECVLSTSALNAGGAREERGRRDEQSHINRNLFCGNC